VLRHLRATGQARRHAGWACYHSDLFTFELGGRAVGVVACAVGAAYAVLVAEQLFASGCRLLLSVTSAGQIAPLAAPPYYVLIERALRDEGTSYHYLPPSRWSVAPDGLAASLEGAFTGALQPVHRGASWTTDAPFRETPAAIDAMRELGILAVEMEAAALYAFARAREQRVLCFAHVTNQMGQVEGDFEKGQQNGAEASLEIVRRAIAGLAPEP
jgi:uridine phosphorylase